MGTKSLFGTQSGCYVSRRRWTLPTGVLTEYVELGRGPGKVDPEHRLGWDREKYAPQRLTYHTTKDSKSVRLFLTEAPRKFQEFLPSHPWCLAGPTKLTLVVSTSGLDSGRPTEHYPVPHPPSVCLQTK